MAQFVIHTINSLGIWSGSVIVAIICLVVFLLFRNISSKSSRLALGGAAALASAYALYWTPFWLGAPDDQLESWEPLFVGTWFISGFSIYLIAYVLRK